MLFTKNDFGEGFKWGVSTAAHQVEGAHNIDGKGLSIWDTFAEKKNKIFNNDNANTACDFYTHYADDIALIYKLNIPNYRFSISWSRILPHGVGAINHKGIDFYNRVIDFCLELGIEPWITLYHWDLPHDLQQKGGWTNREVIHWFSYFVDCCLKNFGDRVKHWMVLNEPMVFTGAGYFLGVHAPGKKGLSSFLAAAHHAALCQAEGGRMIRSLRHDCKVGTTFSYSHIEPYRADNEKDIRAAVKADALLNRLFIEPLLGLGYPTKDVKIIERIERFMYPHDEQKLAFDMDFIGLQNYTRELIAHAPLIPFVHAKIIKASKRNVPHTLMDWEIHPPSIYHALKRYNNYKGIKEIIVTENGAAFPDVHEEGKVNDFERVKYLQDHIAQVLKAKQEGVKVNGYFVWTLMDNFEWAEGYFPRFGLVYVDFTTQQRVVKNSGRWYSQFLKNTVTASMEVWEKNGSKMI
ncbi:GH1 family beta-glucosidase [Ferruginibacter sp. SUN106]|uniref:GH1 family beta-glucosidase n=1 Tax=Ferruginibacter sp. SUN106 TaxID=2978348 RepID=UPI003D36BED2